MPMTLVKVKEVERGEQSGRPIALVVGTADWQYKLPHARTLETAGLGRFQAVGLYAKHREIRSRISCRNTSVE
jgi:hypothetical protein